MGLVMVGLVNAGLAALGVRLLRLSRRTGARPELWLGLAFLSAGGSAWLIPLAATDGLPAATARSLALARVRSLPRLFTPTRALALAAARCRERAAAVAVIASGMPLPIGRVGLFVLLARCAVLLWLFAESAFYAQRMRRRIRLGLGDPLVANRFPLWAIWTGALACIPLFVLSLRVLGVVEAPVPGAPLPAAVRAIIAVLGAGGATALVARWLAFFPPATYRSWIERTATAR